MNNKRNLSFWEMWNLSFGFFGVQIAYALQSANISRIFATLGADPHQLSFFWILPPLMGMIVQPYRLEEMKSLLGVNGIIEETGTALAAFYTQQAEKLHMSAGIGLHVIMNQNFNINFEFGKAFCDGYNYGWANNDGAGLGINIGLNYIF